MRSNKSESPAATGLIANQRTFQLHSSGRSISVQMPNRADRRKAARALRKGVRPQDVASRSLAINGLSQRLVERTAELIQAYGPPPSDKELAAAHEAGHVMVGMLLGGRFEKCYLTEVRSGVWEGYSSVFVPGVHFQGIGLVQDDPVRSWFLAMNWCGGIAGEQVIGRLHPASSTDEQMLVAGTAAVMDRIWGQDGVCDLIQMGTADLIARHQQHFDRLRKTLAARGFLTQKDVVGIPVVDRRSLLPAVLGGEV